jgi:hypothetical protein
LTPRYGGKSQSDDWERTKTRERILNRKFPFFVFFSPVTRQPTQPEPCAAQDPKPLYQTLLCAVLELMFCPGFTVNDPSKVRFPHMDPYPEATAPLREVYK